MSMLGLVATLSLIVLLGVYISENWVSPTWQGLSKPISLVEVLREWLIYMVVFSGLAALLDEVLRFACWTVC
jgi:hypothetical protein